MVDSISNDKINAFRYKEIPDDIFNYLNSMNFSIYNGTKENVINGLHFEGFSRVYEEIMRAHKWFEHNCIPETIKEYKTDDLFISAQLCLTFRNLAYFLTAHGFTNDNDIDECKNIADLLSSRYYLITMKNWNLKDADLEFTYLSGSHFEGAHLERANLKGALLEMAFFNFAHLEFAHLEFAHLEFAHLENAYFEEANLKGAHLNRAHLQRIHMEKVSLNEANLQDTHLENANLQYANLQNANLQNAHLQNAHLKNADLTRANLTYAELIDADLTDAILIDTNLIGADFTGVDFTNANLDGSMYCKSGPFKTIFPTGFNPDKAGMIAVDENNDNNRSEEEN